MVKVRTATLEDIPTLVELGRALHAESPRYSMLSYNPKKVGQVALLVIQQGGTLVAVKDETIIGFIAGYVCAHWFGDDLMASDYSFYIKPEHRCTGRTALLLLKRFEEWAISKGALDVVPGSTTMINTEGTATFFEKLGYTRSGIGFFKRVR